MFHTLFFFLDSGRSTWLRRQAYELRVWGDRDLGLGEWLSSRGRSSSTGSQGLASEQLCFTPVEVTGFEVRCQTPDLFSTYTGLRPCKAI